VREISETIRLKPHVACVGCLAVFVITAGGQRPAIDARSVAAFVGELQQAVGRDDRAAVSALVRYPLTVFAGGVRIPITDPGSLRQNYDVVFSPALKSVIAQAAVSARGSAASSASVIIAPDSTTIGADAIRIERVGEGLKITRITVPLTAPAAEGEPRAGRRGSRPPDKLSLEIGRIQRAGALAAGERDVYVLTVQKNRLLDVRITGVNGRDIVVRISNVKSRAPIDARAQEGVRTWIGRVPEDGDYRIEVVRLASGGAPRLEYLIAVSVR
jgi:hypothetical protein